MPMKDSVTAAPTVRWKWPGTHVVLCTTRFMEYEALINPPVPPAKKRSIASTCARKLGSPHGRRNIQPNSQREPFSLPAYSNEAMMVKAVMKLGKATMEVRKA